MNSSHSWVMTPDGKNRLLKCVHCGALALIVSKMNLYPEYISTIICFAGMEIGGITEWLETRPAPVVPFYCNDTVHLWNLERVKYIMES
jgi:hypothetical protein